MRNGSYYRLGRKLVLLIIASFGLLDLPAALAYTGNAAASTNHASTTAVAPHGTLYRVRYHDHISYLFGTIHVGRPEFFPLEARATQAFAMADTYALEVDMRDAAAVQSAVNKYGLYAGNDTLDKHLSPASLARVKLALAQAGIPFESVAHAKAWMVANLFEVALFERQGYHAELGTDLVLLKSAETQGKAIQGLETADYQFSLFNGLSDAQQEQYLNDGLDELQSGEALQKLHEMVDAWQSADEKALEGLLQDMQTDETTTGKFFRQVMIAQRNPTLAGKIEALLKQDKASFVGIGVLHLLGADGIPQLLTRRGYEVTRLY
jgi:uncharacterized protein YbaP (TraB family)